MYQNQAYICSHMQRNKTIQISKIALSFLLIAIFGWYYASVSLNQHIHIVNGIAVSHSHPYDGNGDNPNSPIKEHKHNSSIYVLPDQPVSSVLISANLQISPCLNSNFTFLPVVAICNQPDQRDIASNGLRAPPIV